MSSAYGTRREQRTPLRSRRFFVTLRSELSLMIVIALILAFLLAWILAKCGINGWTALPITIVAVLLFTYITSRKLTYPLAQMCRAANAMADGDYSVRIRLHKQSHDEVGQLAHAFNEMADELEHADQMRRDLISNVSHELRTPVAALQATVENMADGVVEPSAENLESILLQTQRLTNLISFLLDLSRIEAGAASLQPEPIHMAPFIEDVVAPLQIIDSGHNHTIKQEIPDDVIIEADRDRLNQLFTNIIANALKHSQDNTEILVTARTDDSNEHAIINVINYGSHIPEHIRQNIFQRFVKGKSSPGVETGGTGLGLSIAQWAAQLHGGNVQVVDDPRGVNFEITLPLFTQNT